MLPSFPSVSAVLITVVFFVSPARGQCVLSPTDQWGGGIGSTAVIGDSVFAEIGTKLVRFDTSNQAAVRRASETAYGDFRFAALGDYLVLVAGELQILDVSNPDSPSVVGRFDAGGVAENTPAGVPIVWMDHVYCAAREGGTRIFDVSADGPRIEMWDVSIPSPRSSICPADAHILPQAAAAPPSLALWARIRDSRNGAL